MVEERIVAIKCDICPVILQYRMPRYIVVEKPKEGNILQFSY